MKITNIKNKLLNFFTRKTDVKQENKISYAEVPTQYEFDMFKIAQDRYSIIKDVNYLCGENGDIRFQRANYLIGEDATKGGFSIVVNGSYLDRKLKLKEGKDIIKSSPKSDKIQKILDDFLERTKLHIICTEHASSLIREGDLFLNVVVDLKSGLILQIKRAPVLTMKKNCNEYGEFIDIERAYSQIDANNIYSIANSFAPSNSRADFALYQINHIKWLSDETKIYGMSQYAVSRKCYRKLEKMEEALAYRRIFRSVSKRVHTLDKCSAVQIEEYKRVNAMVDKYGNPTKNNHMLSDYIGNVKVEALHDEADLDQIKDIEFVENNLWVNLLTPKAIITGGQGINRDVLKVQYPHYLKSLEAITDRLEYGDTGIYSGYRAIIDLQLLLAGINPQTVSYDVVWSQKTWDNITDRVEAVQLALGKGGGKQLLSHEKAIQFIASDFDIEDPAMIYKSIIEEQKIGKQNIVKEETTQNLNDEYLNDKNKIDEHAKNFTTEWNSFFNAVFKKMSNNLHLKNATNIEVEDILKNLDNAWNIEFVKFNPKYLSNLTSVGQLASATGMNLINKNLIQDDVRIGNIKIEREDIYDDLYENSGSRIVGIKETILKKIRETLADGFDNSKGWKSLMNEIKPIIIDPVRAEMISITELSWAYNRSIERVYKGAKVEKVIWDASIDLKTCQYCNSMHNMEFPINDHPDNPAHPRCRCTWLPKLGKEDE